jgi:glycosyltransferase involved in cell wall biosynthesis
MKILWMSPSFLHPTTRGGQIRTLEIVKRLNRRHEIHYVALEDPRQPEGPRRSGEYSTRSYAMRHRAPAKRSPAFAWQLAKGLFARLPVAVSRFYNAGAARLIAGLLAREEFDRVVCDFLVSAPHFPRLADVILFQHNVETTIWRRHAEHSRDPLRRFYFGLQARRMFDFEGRVCRAAGSIIAVSAKDADSMRRLFGAERVHQIPTGVDVDYFQAPERAETGADLVFIGSMDWMPNIDGTVHFVKEILPLIRRQRPDCRLAIVGREPAPEIVELGRRERECLVTGTVPDVRPYLWSSAVSIVPLRIGGGTRLKIYESMAAGVPVVSTSVGAEGLACDPGRDILIADSPEEFAGRCLELLESKEARARIGGAGRRMVRERFSWEQVVERFEEVLREGPAPRG